MTQEQDRVELVRDGEARFALHRLPWQSAEDIIEPADELVRCLERSVGRPVPAARLKNDPHPVALVLHRDVRAPLEREEFEVEATADRVVLRARTVAAMFHAVYWFLETAVGVRWLWPGESGEVVPRRRDISLPLGVRREKPDYAWRAIQTGGACNQAMDINTTLHAQLRLPPDYLREFQRWCRRNRFGGLRVADGHRWAEIAPPAEYGEARPEYFALVNGQRDCRPGDGKHGNQPCLANDDVAKLIADYACARFDADADLDVFSVAMNDGGASCECADCEAIDAEAGATDAAALEHFDRLTAEATEQSARPRAITDRLCRHLQLVAAQVREEHPGRLLLTHLYGHYRRPPRTFHLPDEVIGQYCVMGALFWNAAQRDAELERIEEMGRFASRLGIYEYYSNGAWHELHRLFPRLVGDTVRAYHRAGARYFATQPGTGFAVNGLNLFVLGRCLWDVTTDPAAVVEDFCRAGFGPAAETVHRYLGAFAQRWRETESGTAVLAGVGGYEGFARLYPGDFLDARAGDLVEAAAQANGHADVQRRIAFLQAGLNYTRLYCAACRVTAALLATLGAKDLRAIDPAALPAAQRPAIAADARAALRAWDAYWDFVREHMGQYVFGEFWVHYRRGPFGANDADLAKLRALAAGGMGNGE